MKFGKEFKTHLEETLPEWRDKFLCYKSLKKLLKSLNNQDPSPADIHLLQHWFVRTLNQELRKFNSFYVDKEEDFVIRLQELNEIIGSIKDKSSKDGVFTSESEFSEEMIDILRDLVTIHGEMVLLINYSSLNFTGLIKILKKYDKRTGGLLCLPFMQLALGQPFFMTKPLTRLVHECEANLELLLPLEAEVIQSRNHKTQDILNPPSRTTANVSPETPANLGEETMDIYRSTLAAMRTIRGLRKASSTCNPLSFSSLSKSKDDESTGAVTAENSASNSPTTMQNEEDSNQDDAPSV